MRWDGELSLGSLEMTNLLLLSPDVPRVGVGSLEDGVLGKVVDHCKPTQLDYYTNQKARLPLIGPDTFILKWALIRTKKESNLLLYHFRQVWQKLSIFILFYKFCTLPVCPLFSLIIPILLLVVLPLILLLYCQFSNTKSTVVSVCKNTKVLIFNKKLKLL